MAAQLPLSVAVPAASAALTYLDAKLSVSKDLWLIRHFFSGMLEAVVTERRDRVNVFYVLEAHARSSSTADRPFIHYQGREWTYRQAYDIVLKYGTWLSTRFAVSPGDIVAVDFKNSELFVWIWFGLWSIGAKPAFINYNLTGKSLVHCVKTSTARILLVEEEIRPHVSAEVLSEVTASDFRQGKGPVEVVFFSPELEKEIEVVNGVRAPDEARSGQELKSMAALIYTSGTTGLPKPAIVSWLKASYGARFVSKYLPLKKTDRMYTCMPLYHSSAALLGLCSALRAGSSLAIGRQFSTKTFWEDVRSSNSTIIQYVGETCRYLLAAPPSDLDKEHSVRIAFGNGLRPDVWNKFKERFNIPVVVEFYAATEGPYALWNISTSDHTAGAVGHNGFLASLLINRAVAIVKLDIETNTPLRDPRTNFCIPVPADTPGEVLFRLDPSAVDRSFQGYFNNAPASRKKVLRDVFRPGDAWFSTGDIMRRDRDGRWFFSDRVGDTFRWKAENVSTADVGHALGEHAAVADANVYGVRVPGHDGRAGCAAVVLRDVATHAPVPAGSEAETRVLDDLARHVRNRLPRYAVPVFLRVGADVRTTGTNKQQKHELREEGVDPARVGRSGGGDRLFWLRDGRYVPFGDREWEVLNRGGARL